MTDKDKRRRIARRFLEDPVPPRIHKKKKERRDDRERWEERR